MKKSQQYKGQLSFQKIADGMNAANRNARRLCEDAGILLKEGRYPSAVSFAILSIEEAGKVSILRELSLSENQEEILNSWKEYRTHTKKNVLWMAPELMRSGKDKFDDFKELFSKDAEHPYILDRIKQFSLYSDCLEGEKWVEPHLVIDKDLATKLFELAKIFSSKKEEVISKEVELWVMHMKPVFKSSIDSQKEALMRWYADMQKVGLKPEGVNEMKVSLEEGLKSLHVF